jgi:ATP-binding cassette subfamily B protein
MNSGAACLYMVACYYKKKYDEKVCMQMESVEADKDSLPGVSRIAEKMEFRTRIVKLTYKQLLNDVRLPCILQWKQGDFMVLFPQARWKRKKEVTCTDYAKGNIIYSEQDFIGHWAEETPELGMTGNVLLLEPTLKFKKKKIRKINKLSWSSLLQYLQHSRWQVSQVLFSLLLTSLFQLSVPFLTQRIVDIGIRTRDLNYIIIVLAAQMMLVFSRTIVNFIRNHLLLHISTMVSLSILADFWIKITRLPITYFDRNHTGEILQRIDDNRLMQNFLTGSALNTLFSALNFVVFAVALVMYKVELFLILGVGVTMYFLWMRAFLGIRRKINYRIFLLSSKGNNATLQLVQGMQEIRLNNIEQVKRWEWEDVQTEIFKFRLKTLSYDQIQQAGAILINQGKDVVLTFLVARSVMYGQLTFGSMLALQYIIGQLSGPIEQFISFVQESQNAKISMERLNEVHQLENEESPEKIYSQHLPKEKRITLDNLSFAYPGSANEMVLHNIRLEIPEGKITAIVGVSGSGKTTLLKLLLKFYERYEGCIRIGETDFKDISPSAWRKQCGAVLQDGYIFNDTIAKNIAVGYDEPDHSRLIEACRMANILSFIESLPGGFNTRLGTDGMDVSQGQKQRLLIARVVYKRPDYLFFDESTNALDANNERAIVENLQSFFVNRTVIVIAHRLSTVKNADRIIVLNRGTIIEQGTHRELSQLKGKYYELVKNQLELGS